MISELLYEWYTNTWLLFVFICNLIPMFVYFTFCESICSLTALFVLLLLCLPKNHVKRKVLNEKTRNKYFCESRLESKNWNYETIQHKIGVFLILFKKQPSLLFNWEVI